jgi:uncharacterized protein with von Willebrand factor type A (vWA) domain
MVQGKEEKLQYIEDMLQKNIRLVQKSRMITAIGSLCIVAVFVIFGFILYGRYSNFDVLELQGHVALKAPRALAPELANFRNDLRQTLYPKLLAEIQARAPQEMPKLRGELEKQMVLVIDDTKALMKKKITDDTTLVVRESIARGVENFQLTAEQQQAVERFAEESIELVLIDMQPFIEKESQKAADQLRGLYDTFYNLEDYRLAQYLWPDSPEDATIELLKSMLELAAIKLDDEDVRNFLKTDMKTKVNMPVLQ